MIDIGLAYRIGDMCAKVVGDAMRREGLPPDVIAEVERVYNTQDLYGPVVLDAMYAEAREIAEREAKAILARDPGMLRTIAAVLVEVAGHIEGQLQAKQAKR